MVYNGTAVSYAALARAVKAAIDHLETQEFSTGSAVVVMVNTLPDCWVAVLALQALGIDTVCAKSTAVLDVLGLSNIAGIVTTARGAHQHQFTPDAGMGNTFVALPDPEYSDDDWSGLVPVAAGQKVGGHILYTSGTTGNYKKLFLSGELQLRRNAHRVECNPYYRADTVYHCLDFGLWTALGYRNPLATWHSGGCVIFDQRKDWYQHFLSSGLSHATLLPDKLGQLLSSLAEQPSTLAPQDFHLVVSGGFVSRKLAEQVISSITRKLENAYGSTEIYVLFLRSMVTNLDDLHWLNPPDYRTVEIVDEAGHICPVDQEGQLRVHLTELDCSAYLDDRQTSEKIFQSGYFYPGDMAVRRVDGRIRILGRSAGVINFNGRKYSVAPIEQEIQNRLGVREVCLFSGVNRAGDVHVVVALEAGQWPDKSDLEKMSRDFAEFEQVQFALFQLFPRTQSGTNKVDRIALRKLVFPVH